MAVDTLIFDLDDTLFDTWGQLVRPAAREACAAMVAAGLNADLEQAVVAREALFLARPRVDLYALLVEHFGVRPGYDARAVRDQGHHAYFGREVEPHIQLGPGTRELLLQLQRRYSLHLVTSGAPRTQARKVELLALSPYFDEIRYIDPEVGQTKRAAFEAILAKYALQPAHVVCIGDRPDREILAGNQLGLITVRIRGGEFGHLDPQQAEEHAQHVLDDLTELAELLTRL